MARDLHGGRFRFGYNGMVFTCYRNCLMFERHDYTFPIRILGNQLMRRFGPIEIHH